jgi:outer membrane protein insertion porin family
MLSTPTKFSLFALLITSLWFLPPSFGQEQNLEILSIKVEGNLTTSSALILSVCGLEEGKEVNAAEVQDAIKQIYGLGLFSDVQVLADPAAEGVNLILKVEEYPRLAEIRIDGEKKIKEKDIEEVLDLTTGKLVSPYEVKNNVNSIRKLYEEKGYRLAEVESEIYESKEKPGEVVLKFKIKEGSKVKIKEINFVGNHAFTDKRLRSKMSNRQDSFWRSGEFDKEKYEADNDKLYAYYRKKGFINFTVLSDSIWYDDSREHMYIQIEVSEGNRYRFGKVTFSGNQVFSTERLVKLVKFNEGDFYDQEKYGKTVENIATSYQDEGYWYLKLRDETKERGLEVDVDYSLEEGSPVHVNLIKIQGNTKTKEKVIRRELSIKPKQVFKRSVLGRSLRDVMILNYFSNVTPDWEVLENGDVNLILNVEEKPTGQASVGAGYSQRDKVVGTLGLGIPNFRGNGQLVSVSWEFGKYRNSIDFSFTEPWFLDTPTSVGIDIYSVIRSFYGYYDERRKGFGLRLGRRLRWPDNYFRLYWGYRFEDIKYTDISEAYGYLREHDHYQTSAMTTTLVRDSRDLPQFATSGSVNSFSTELGGGLLGGSWDYHKEIISTSWYFRTVRDWALVLKGKLGIVANYDGGSEVPYSERFTPGGTDPDGTIRGYDDSRVGPRDAYGRILGGRALIVYNLEYQIPLSAQQFYLLAFADAGNAYSHVSNLKPFSNFYRSFGLGFRVVAPMVGIIGFDFAYPLDGPDKGSWMPHFQIGPGY